MSRLRIIGDVHGQIIAGDVIVRDANPYLHLIADTAYSIQVGDMGDPEAYEQLAHNVDPSRHRFLPGNHEQYDALPPHSLGDSGIITWAGVEFFFARGAASTDREKLVRTGHELGKTLWFEQEELTDEQMHAATQAYVSVRPQIVFTHDAPAHVARLAWNDAQRFRARNPEAMFAVSRTHRFLTRLLELHQPRLWVFGHYHHDWKYREGGTNFVCVGQLSYIDIDERGELL